MEPDDSDFEISGSDSNQYVSESDYNSDAFSARSVILGEDGEEARKVGDGSADQQLPRKRPGGDEPLPRPFKRQRSHLNPDYLDLLNKDIDDAALRVCLDDDTALPDSQLGLTHWSSPEKKQFFEALARLGRHDLPGIAQRVGTKSPVEVKHYLRVLLEAVLAHRAQNSRSYLVPAEYPAAVELTPPCCHAQEEAADAVSIRQEARESQREEKKWQDYWDITPKLAAGLEKKTKKPKDDTPAKLVFARLFHVSRWLKLSDRMFMNSSIPGNNWRNIDSRPPSMWATTLEDFHSLALSITQRLVQTTLFISMSRIRAKLELRPGTRKIVRKKDVEAAIASLGLSHNANEMWHKSARRLRLDVYENPPTRDQAEEEEEEEEEEDEEPMTYDEVEAALANEEPRRAESVDSDLERIKLEPLSSGDEEDDDDSAADDSGPDGHRGRQPLDAEAAAVNREINEVLWYAAAGLRDLPNTRRALRLRVETERQQESHADAVDEHASQAAETAMWTLLHRAPPVPRPKVPKPQRGLAEVHRSNLDVESLYPMSRAWADDLEYQAEWETLRKPVYVVSHDNEDDYD